MMTIVSRSKFEGGGVGEGVKGKWVILSEEGEEEGYGVLSVFFNIKLFVFILSLSN